MNKIVLANGGTLELSTLSTLKDKCTELGYELVEEEKLKVELPKEKVYTIMQPPPPLPDITMLDSPVSNCRKVHSYHEGDSIHYNKCIIKRRKKNKNKKTHRRKK